MRFHSTKGTNMRRRLLQTALVVLSMFLSVGSFCPNANGQTAEALPNDVIAANRELDHQLLEGHRLLDAEKVMGLFTSSPDIFFIAPDGELYKGPDQVRQAWVRFFASLQSIHGEINDVSYLRGGDGVIAVGQVTYYRQLKNGKPQQRVVAWTDFRHKENGKWVYVFRHAHWPLEANAQSGAAPAKGSTAEQIHVSPNAQTQFVGTWKLVSTEENLKDGSSRPYQDVGAHGTGYLIYTADGHMCVELIGADRPTWNFPATSAQKVAALDSFSAYCGRYEVDDVNHVMWHYPDMALDPNFAGTKQRRPYRFEGNRLIYSGKQAPEEDDQTVDRWTIVWERPTK
jgi:ketosteroid isomerase-like protein